MLFRSHSRIYAEKKRGLHPSLKISGDRCSEQFDVSPENPAHTCFALNDLSFEGENKSDKYTEPLERLLGAWMKGNTDIQVKAGFTFKVKAPSIPQDHIANLLDKYAIERDKERNWPAEKTNQVSGNALFLGSSPRLNNSNSRTCELLWRWRLEERSIKTKNINEAENITALLKLAGKGKGLDAVKFYSSLEEISGNTNAGKIWKHLRESGLAVYRL